MTPAPTVSVVVPYYDDQAGLTLVLRALAQQTGGVRFDVVVSDDGSPAPPLVPSGLPYRCTVVRQPDRGFRAAAARNLGAGRSTADLLLFLDGDTVPTAGYVAAMVARLRAIDDGHGALVVGRRRHADLAAVDPDAALRFLRDDPPGRTHPDLRILPEPGWLRDGYERTDHLNRAGEEDFRLIISAVLGVDRRLWQATGGFDPSFVGYGGEDWDLGWRSWLAGARWAYEPAAVAWHDGPDAAGRSQPPAVKNAESLRLARTVPLPSVRGRGLVLAQPDIVIRYAGPTAGTAQDAAVVACVADLLAGADAAVWFAGPASRLPPLLADDPRVHAGAVPLEVRRRARFVVTVHRPLRLPVPLADLCAAGESDVPGRLQVHHTRARNRREPWPGAPAPDLSPIPADLSLERAWGGW